jgi:ATP-dependent Lon protease
MFDSLSDQIRDDAKGQKTTKERIIEYLAIAVLSLVVFGGLFFGVRMLQ